MLLQTSIVKVINLLITKYIKKLDFIKAIESNYVLEVQTRQENALAKDFLRQNNIYCTRKRSLS
jgi:hypothetical protein